MTEYRVVYMHRDDGRDGSAVAASLQRECNTSAREGWRLATAVPDSSGGSNRGLWLFFASDLEPSTVKIARELAAEDIA